MKLHYRGKFDGNAESLPHGDHQPGAVKFKELEDPKKLACVANGIAIGLYVVLIPVLMIRGDTLRAVSDKSPAACVGNDGNHGNHYGGRGLSECI